MPDPTPARSDHVRLIPFAHREWNPAQAAERTLTWTANITGAARRAPERERWDGVTR